MSRTPSIYSRQAQMQESMRLLRHRCSKLAVAMMEDKLGIPERAYRQLQCLFAELGGMPDVPHVDAVDGRVHTAEGLLD